MIRWLADKDPDVWFAITPLLNWDNAVPVLQWIVSQPDCDKANAASIFWAADPTFFALRLVRGERTDLQGWELIETVLRNWEEGFYRRSNLRWPGRDETTRMAYYEAKMRQQPGARAALRIPQGLLGPMIGRKPRVPASMLPGENAELWDLLDRLGTRAGFRPGSEEWHARPAGRWKASSEESGLARLFGKPNWSGTAIFWLGLSLALSIWALWLTLRP